MNTQRAESEVISMEHNYTFEEFQSIISKLRSEDGCPWDKEQTHTSLKPCVMEESSELVSAIRIYDQTGNAENMQEELGDLLLQVLMHSQIASEEGLFTIDDVVQGICEKMIRRHPHVFGTTQVDFSEQVLKNWDEIKKKEKEGKDWIASPLREIPAEHPALTRAPKVLKKIDKLYESRKPLKDCMINLKEDITKINDSIDSEKLTEALGDIMIDLADIGRTTKLPLEQILNDRIEDLIEKYENK